MIPRQHDAIIFFFTPGCFSPVRHHLLEPWGPSCRSSHYREETTSDGLQPACQVAYGEWQKSRADTPAAGMLTNASPHFPQTIPNSNLGEPLNVVISSASSPEVLTEEGLASYLSSLYFSPNNCLGLSLGDKQAADLNDGQGVVNQTALYRYNFNMGTTTCQESINGGQHVR